jgi:hypothetical protein
MRRITGTALVALALATGHAGVSTAHPAADRSCGLIKDSDGARIGIVVKRGSVPCTTARKALRMYFSSDASCEGSSCVRNHAGWTCQTAPASELPRLASCNRGKKRIAAYSTAD